MKVFLQSTFPTEVIMTTAMLSRACIPATTWRFLKREI